MKGHERAVNHTIENSHHDDKEKEENNCVNSLCCRLKPCPFIIYSSSSRNSVVDTIKKEKSCVHHIAVSKDWKNEIIFCITNEILSDWPGIYLREFCGQSRFHKYKIKIFLWWPLC